MSQSEAEAQMAVASEALTYVEDRAQKRYGATGSGDVEVVEAMVQGGRLHHDVAVAGDGEPVSALLVGKTVYEMWGVKAHRLRVLQYLVQSERLGHPTPVSELYDFMGAANTDSASAMLTTLKSRIETSGTPEYQLTRDDAFHIEGSERRVFFSLTDPTPQEPDQEELGLALTNKQYLHIISRSILHARAHLSTGAEPDKIPELQTSAFDILSRLSSVYRRLGLTASRSEVPVLIANGQAYDLTQIVPLRRDVVWRMSDHPGELYTIPTWGRLVNPEHPERGRRMVASFLKEIKDPAYAGSILEELIDNPEDRNVCGLKGEKTGSEFEHVPPITIDERFSVRSKGDARKKVKRAEKAPFGSTEQGARPTPPPKPSTASQKKQETTPATPSGRKTLQEYEGELDRRKARLARRERARRRIRENDD